MPQPCDSSSVAHLETTGQHLFCFFLGWYNCLGPASSRPPSQKLAMHSPLLSLVGTKFRAEWTHSGQRNSSACSCISFPQLLLLVKPAGSNVPEHFP